MKISSLEEYGLRCTLQFAWAFQTHKCLSASDIAQKEALSVEYVSKIMRLLKKAKIVRALRGVQGGFVLSRSPSEISLSQLFSSLQSVHKTNLDNFCRCHSGKKSNCVHLNACHIRPVWDLLLGTFEEILLKISLADLMISQKQVSQKIKSVAIEAIEAIFLNQSMKNGNWSEGVVDGRTQSFV
jgi:Rrf2 family protein